MSLRMKILYLLEEMDGLCLDNEEERMEVAAKLSAALCPPATVEDKGKLDELINMLAALEPRDWDRRGPLRWQVAVGDTDIHLLNTNLKADSLRLYVNSFEVELTSDQKCRLWAFCGKGNKEQHDACLEKALRDLRTLVK